MIDDHGMAMKAAPVVAKLLAEFETLAYVAVADVLVLAPSTLSKLT